LVSRQRADLADRPGFRVYRYALNQEGAGLKEWSAHGAGGTDETFPCFVKDDESFRYLNPTEAPVAVGPISRPAESAPQMF